MIDRSSRTRPFVAHTIRVVLATALALAAVIGKDWSLEARHAVFGQRQIQFYAPYSGSTPVILPPVLLVAHNAGNQAETASRANSHEAAGIEIDVRYVDAVLYATHGAPASFMPMRAWQAPKLREAWRYASGATVLKLDLKSTGQHALESLVRFIQSRPSDQQILIVSRSQEALIFLDDALPESIQILSLSTGNDIDLLLEHDGRIDGVDGISIPEWTLTAQRIAELKARGYLIDAWTVNEVERLVELTSLGVDAITTDNLAFFGMAVETSQAPGASSN